MHQLILKNKSKIFKKKNKKNFLWTITVSLIDLNIKAMISIQKKTLLKRKMGHQSLQQIHVMHYTLKTETLLSECTIMRKELLG